MIQIAVSDNSVELIARLDQLPKKWRRALLEKMSVAVEEIYAKVHGHLPSFKIDHGVEEVGGSVVGWFEPGEPKAIAREFGGKGWYFIFPTKARLLVFIGARDGRKVFTPSVFHPPSKEFRDIRNAIDEKMPDLKSEIAEIMKRIR